MAKGSTPEQAFESVSAAPVASEGDFLGEAPPWEAELPRPGKDGEAFLFEQNVDIVPVWGSVKRPRWASGEPLYLFARPGAGKSTLAQNLALGRLGVPSFRTVLEGDVAVGEGTVLYLAMDRPKQVARSMSRMVSGEDRELLRDYLRFWAGPPPFRITETPDRLLPWIDSFGGVKTVVVDSLFNIAPALTDEDGSAAANNAFQQVVAYGIELIVVHHDRKQGESRRRSGMDDMYGGRAISAGAGSIAAMEGDPEEGWTLRWVKTPAGHLGKQEYRIDFTHGRIEEPGFFDALKKKGAVPKDDPW